MLNSLLATDPLHGKKYRITQDNKWPTIVWRISLWQGARHILWVPEFTFICSERFLLFASKQGKKRERVHSLPYDSVLCDLFAFQCLI